MTDRCNSSSTGKSALERIDSVVRAFANGLTFGYADNLSAMADARILGKGTYEDNLVKETEKTIARNNNYPAESAAGLLAGTLGPVAVAAFSGNVPAVAATGAYGIASQIQTVASTNVIEPYLPQLPPCAKDGRASPLSR